jgi:hypothetical protein
MVELFHMMGGLAKLSMLAGLGPLVVAIAYAARPTERRLAFMRPLSLVAIFAALCVLLAGIAMTLRGLGSTTPELLHMGRAYHGLAESLVPPFVNFAVLAVAWLVVAVGMLRRS